MTSWHGYPKVHHFGHRESRAVFGREVLVEEKVDGSQFSFGVFELPDGETELRTRSKVIFQPDEAPDLFRAAVDTVQSLHRAERLRVGWTYRGEVLRQPKHNVLVYGRVPRGNVILFDVDTDEETRLGYTDLCVEAARVGLEAVPLLFRGELTTPDELRQLLGTESILGNVTIEGVVVKPVVPVFGVEHRAIMAKYVSERFKEQQQRGVKVNPQRPLLQALAARYATPRRWEKAVERLRDAGLLTDTPRDIGPLIAEVKRDVWDECSDEIARALASAFERDISRGLTVGLPEWYKARLLDVAFEAVVEVAREEDS